MHFRQKYTNKRRAMTNLILTIKLLLNTQDVTKPVKGNNKATHAKSYSDG